MDYKINIALDYMRRAQIDVAAAVQLLDSRIQLAREYGATEEQIRAAAMPEGGTGAKRSTPIHDVPDRLLATPEGRATE